MSMLASWISEDPDRVIQQGRDIVGPFACDTPDAASPFADWYREASQRVRAMRFLFAD